MRKDFWSKANVAVIGAGSWGTALAWLLSQKARHVTLWMRDPALAIKINTTHRNPKYHTQLRLAPHIRATASYEEVFSEHPILLLWALPAQATREQAQRFAPFIKGTQYVVHATKGVEQGSLKRVSEILKQQWGPFRIGVLSGPNLSQEVIQKKPTLTLIGSPFEEVQMAATYFLESDFFSIQTSTDLIGIEWVGALKNILAIAAGCFDALNWGWNARAFLFTQGLQEMLKISTFFGAQPQTLWTAAGVGDLFATALSTQSRNYQVGFQLGQGRTLKEILAQLPGTAEGVFTLEALFPFLSKWPFPTPLFQAVFQLFQTPLQAQTIFQKALHETTLSIQKNV